jgi:hypothetical protein
MMPPPVVKACPEHGEGPREVARASCPYQVMARMAMAQTAALKKAAAFHYVLENKRS